MKDNILQFVNYDYIAPTSTLTNNIVLNSDIKYFNRITSLPQELVEIILSYIDTYFCMWFYFIMGSRVYKDAYGNDVSRRLEVSKMLARLTHKLTITNKNSTISATVLPDGVTFHSISNCNLGAIITISSQGYVKSKEWYFMGLLHRDVLHNTTLSKDKIQKKIYTKIDYIYNMKIRRKFWFIFDFTEQGMTSIQGRREDFPCIITKCVSGNVKIEEWKVNGQSTRKTVLRNEGQTKRGNYYPPTVVYLPFMIKYYNNVKSRKNSREDKITRTEEFCMNTDCENKCKNYNDVTLIRCYSDDESGVSNVIREQYPSKYSTTEEPYLAAIRYDLKGNIIHQTWCMKDGSSYIEDTTKCSSSNDTYCHYDNPYFYICYTHPYNICRKYEYEDGTKVSAYSAFSLKSKEIQKLWHQNSIQINRIYHVEGMSTILKYRKYDTDLNEQGGGIISFFDKSEDIHEMLKMKAKTRIQKRTNKKYVNCKKDIRNIKRRFKKNKH